MHLVTFIDAAAWLLAADYIFLGLAGFAAIMFIAKEQIPIRFQPAQVLLVLFVAWYILSCISMSVRYGDDWVNHNSFPMLNTAVSMFLAFPLGYVLIREKQNKTGTILLHTLLICWTLFIVYVLIRVFQGETIPTPNGGIIRMKKSLQLNCNRNITGAWEMLAFLMSCYLAFRCRPLPFRIIYGLSAVIHYTALALSNSRISIVSALAGFAAMTGITVYLQLQKRRKTHPIAFAILAGLLAGAAFYFLSGQVIRLYNACTASRVSVRSTVAKMAADTTFNGRLGIWENTIKGVFSSFRTAVFGVTPISVSDLIYQAQGGTGKKWAHAHNQFLQILASNGIPGLCLFLGWFFLMLKDTWKLFITQQSRTVFLFIPVIILSLMLTNQMEVFLVYSYQITGFAFFLLCGILHGRANDPVPAGKPSRLTVIDKLKAGMNQTT